MNVIVVGAGEVGFDVARLLSRDQHDVKVIDVDADALASVGERLDVLTVHGNGASATTLDAAGIRAADMMIAVTALDEVNIIACMIADRLGVKTKVARIRSEELARTESVLKASDFGIDLVIHPEESAAAEVVRLIRRASATDVLMFNGGRTQVVGMRVAQGSPAIGRTLIEIAQNLAAHRFRVMAIGRGIRTIVPRGSEKLRGGDQVFVLAQPKVIPHIARALGENARPMQHIMILGGTNVGAKIALQLSETKSKRVKLVEPDRKRAEHLAAQLPNVLVIHCDATDVDVLVREGLAEMDAFVAVTEDEESNLVTCLMAKHLEVRKTVALLSKGAYIPISQSIGLDAAVSTKLAVSREVMQFLRGTHVLSVATIHGLDTQILEVAAAPRSPITRKPLEELSLPAGMIVGSVQKGRDVIVATGQTQIEAGDCVILFAMPRVIPQVEKLFQR